jgi:hypothetical protein
VNGEVFVVHGGVAAVMEPPRVRSAFRAAGTADGMWTVEAVAAACLDRLEGAREAGNPARPVS